MTRLFVAVWPPEPFLDRLADVERPRDHGVKWVARENLHVTVRFLGDADEDEVIGRLDDAVFPAATAAAGPGFDLLGDRTLVLPMSGVDDLAEVADRALRGVGSAPDRRRYFGHLTVARLRRNARPARSLGRLFDGRFEITEVALVASTLTDAGAVYETIETWPTW